MRVVHWYPNFLAGGGVANSVLALANAQADAGADTWIVSLAHEEAIYGEQRLVEAVNVATWEKRRALSVGGLRLTPLGRRPARALRALDPDVVHIHAEFNPDNWWAPRLWDCPLVLSPHGAFHSAVLRRGARAKSLYLKAAGPALYGKVASFHVLSPAERTDLAAALPAAHTYCVPQGPSPAVQAALDESQGSAANGRSGPARLMFIGRIDVQVKGLDLLVEAFARAVSELGQSAPATLTLAGPDWRGGTAPLRELAARLGVEALVEMPGRVAADDVARLLRSCDIYVQLSRNESSPLSLNDALALGKPAIVSSRVGTVSSDEISGLPHVTVVEPAVAPAADAIAAAIENLDGLRAAAREAHEELREFLSWERAAQRHLEHYASLRRSSPTGRGRAGRRAGRRRL